jgi:hypothetical protein
MTEETSTSRGARNRRTMAVLAWTALVALAITLWVCRSNGMIQNYTTEPIALMLSAYAAFVSVFSWMLFSPGRKALSESPELFFSAAVTLIPPCIIAFHLMPPESALRGWLTLGLFMFSTIAVLSPVPEEFFAIPRERHTYLRPISGGIFSGVDYQADSTDFKRLAIREPRRRIQPVEEPQPAGPARDPWRDPFADTGTAPSTLRPHRERTKPVQDASSDSQPHQQPARPATPTAVVAPGASSAPAASVVKSPGAANHDAAMDTEIPEIVPPRIAKSDQAARPTNVAAAATASTDTPAVPESLPHAVTSAADNESDDPELSVDRMQDEYGGEMVEGTIKVRFEAGQKRAHLHVPFSPPLAGVPDVECEAVGDEPLRVRVPVRQTYGIRIEARRSDAAEPAETEVGFSAIYTPPDRRY